MIMIVDDDVGLAETCSMLLEAHGFDVKVASSGAEALATISGASLLITDCAMPGMTGVQLSETLKGQESTAHLPILLMSASLRCEIPESRSYDAFLRKPFLAENFLTEVRKLLPRVRAAPTRFIKV